MSDKIDEKDLGKVVGGTGEGGGRKVVNPDQECEYGFLAYAQISWANEDGTDSGTSSYPRICKECNDVVNEGGTYYCNYVG